MAKQANKKLSAEERKELLKVLKTRFEKNEKRHKGIDWLKVQARMEGSGKAVEEKLWALYQMEKTGGEPDVVAFDKKTGEFTFFDCAAETPKERRSLCYDGEALKARKEFKPKSSAMEMAEEMGIELLNEEQYRQLQELGNFDTKTSSWLKTPAEVRKLGGAIFGDYRFGRVFVYHNGAESYYGSRAFRGCLKI